MSDTIFSSGETCGIITGNIILASHDGMQIVPDDVQTITITSPGETFQAGDVLLANTMPQAEYMYGCTPTAVGMLLGYYDLYGYLGADFSALIEGDVDVNSRGTDGYAYDMDAFDTVLGRAIATEDYVYRFYSRGDLDIITGNKAGTYWTTSAEEELEYSFVNGGEGPEIRTDVWNCIADYLGTGQLWRGNDNLSTSISQATLEEILNYNMTINYIAGDLQRMVDWRYTSMLYGLYLYVENRGYSLDREITGTYIVDVAGGDFTFENYKAEIDAGRPVLISLEGHSMVGYGYNPETNEIIFDDCYQADQRMVWGGTYHYSDMDLPLQSITVISLMGGGSADLAMTPLSVDSAEIFFTANAVPFASGEYCYPGDQVSLNFTVSNLGTTASGAFAVTVYVDGTLSKSIAVLSLEGNSSAEYTDIQLDALAPGLHTVLVVADEANEIQETSGTNNALEQKLMVLKVGANIVTGIKTVNDGQVSTNDYVADGWQMHVLSGGTASGTVVRGIVTDVSPEGVISYLPGLAVVSQGGLVQDAEVYEYAQIQLAGTAEDLHVFENGTAVVSTGGKLTGKLTVENGGGISMEEGTTLDFNLTKTSAGAAALVNDLSRIQGTPLYTLTVDGTEAAGTYALADGAADFVGTISVVNTSGESLGELTVGGTSVTVSDIEYALVLTDSVLSVSVTAPDAATSSGLVLTDENRTVGAGELYRDTTVNSGGVLMVDTDGTAEKTTVNEYGELCIAPGGSAVNTTVNSGGFFTVDGDGAANNTLVNSGGELYVAAGGTATQIVENGGHIEVEDEALVTFTPNTFGELELLEAFATVHSGTTAVDTVVGMYSLLQVFSGGTATGATVTKGGEFDIYSGGTAIGVTVTKGGSIYIAGGGTATEIDVPDGGLSFDVAPGTYIQGTSGGVAFEMNTAHLTDYILNGFILSVSSGGTVDGITANDAGIYVYGDGTVNRATINRDGRLDILDGGTANIVTVNPFGSMFVSSGGTATAIKENGGYVSVEDGANVSFEPNTFSELKLSASSATVHSGTTAVDVFIDSLGCIEIFSGGAAVGGTIDKGGTMLIHSGGTATAITENGGYVEVEDGAEVIFASNTLSGMKLSAYATVHSGTTAVDMEIMRYGHLAVSSGGTANNVVVSSNGFLLACDGASLSNTAVSPFGFLYIYSGGVAKDTTIRNKGYCCLSGGTAAGTTVNGGVFVVSEGTADDTTISSGSMFISSGGTATGKMTFEAGAVVSAREGGIMNFDLARTEPGAEALVNDLSIIRGTPLYTLTVDGTQAGGTYMLADGVAKFNRTISVVNTSGDTLGELTVGGETVFVGGTGYTLNLNKSILSVTVEAEDSPAPLSPANPVGTADKVSWEAAGAAQYIVEYSTDDFEHTIRIVTTGNGIDTPELPAGTYQWRVKADGGDEWTVGEAITVEPEADAATKVVQSNEDGNDDLFFASPVGTWENIYYAQHVGSVNDWTGTDEIVSAGGKGRIRNLFFGSADPNVLCLTDGENGDAIFVDDVYTDLPENVAEHTARLYKIQEIRAGAGDDIVDMTSQRFEYTGDGLTIRGGDGDDVIWANKGDNVLFGDAGNDRIVGASGNDVIVGGIGNDSMHGGGGDDVFAFCDNWGADTVQQLDTGSVTLWFASGDESNWNAETLTYTDGAGSVTVSGVSADKITLKFGDDGSAQFASLSAIGAFDALTSRKVFEEADKGLLAGV